MAEGDEPQPPLVEKDPQSRAYIHRRVEDMEAGEITARKHKRWYDSFKVQFGILAAIVSFGGTMIGVGFVIDQFILKVETSPLQISRNAESIETLRGETLVTQNQLWAAINANRISTADLETKLDQSIQVQLELLCYMTTDDPANQRRCVQQQTQQRIENLLQSTADQIRQNPPQ